ncbi:MAG TPA: hypothetical protein V6D37_06105 [Candidatus Sericytochromatia bacterium]
MTIGTAYVLKISMGDWKLQRLTALSPPTLRGEAGNQTPSPL